MFNLIILFAGTLSNIAGLAVSQNFDLPLWLDSIGTIFTAYIIGPVGGMLSAFLGTVIADELLGYDNFLIYCTVGMVSGLIVGICARKKAFYTFSGSMNIALVLILTSSALSTVLNLILFDGMSLNVWSDAIIEFYKYQGYPKASYFLGCLYINFPDKLICVLTLYLFLYVRRHVRLYSQKHRTSPQLKNSKYKNLAKVLMFAVVIPASLTVYNKAEAEIVASSVDTKFDNYMHSIFNTQNGQILGQPNAIAKTKDGALWIGTYAGLFRFTGTDFRKFDFIDSIRSVKSLYVDQKNRLWIGTSGQGLSIVGNDVLVKYLHDKNGLDSNSITSINSDNKGRYYVGTTSGLSIIKEDGPDIYVERIYTEIDYPENISVNNEGLIALTNSFSKSIYLFKDGEKIDTFSDPDPSIDFCAVCFDSKGQLNAISVTGDLFLFDIKDGHLIKKQDIFCRGIGYCNSLYYSYEDQILFLCSENGIFYLDDSKVLRKVKTTDFNNSVEKMLIDYQGNYWFTSSRLGLLELTRSKISNLYSRYNLNEEVVNSIEEWNGKIYCGTDHGIDIIDEKTAQIVHNKFSQLFKGMRVICIRRDARNNLWVAVNGRGIYILSPDGRIKNINKNAGLFSNFPKVILHLEDNSTIVAGIGGYSRIAADGTLTSPSFSKSYNSSILCVAPLSADSILIGTNGNGLQIMKNDQLFKIFQSDEELNSDVILRLIPSRRYNVIFVVTSSGISILDRNLNIKSIKSIPYYNNFDICPDQGKDRVFIIGSNGIYVCSERDLVNDAVRDNYEHIGFAQGITSALTYSAWNYENKYHDLYVAAQNGVYKLNTDNYVLNVEDVKSNLASVTVDGSTFISSHGLPMILSRHSKSIVFSPEVINYSKYDPYVRYYLEGIDPVFKITRASKLGDISYSGLPSGKYVFHLQIVGHNRRNVINEYRYFFEKQAAFYDKKSFKLYMNIMTVFMIAFISWFIARFFLMRIINAQKLKIEIAEQQIKRGDETIMSFAQALDARDERTQKHSARVAEYSVMIARELGFDESQCENLRKVAKLHDIGKIGIPDSILNKPSALTKDEYKIMMSHVTIGAKMLRNFNSIDHLVDGVLYHHERYDGTGYAQGLKGKEIPLYGRIIAVADAFDAMAENRVYRKRLDINVVLNELEKGKGKQFDPDFAEIMIQLVRQGKVNLTDLYNEKTAVEPELSV
ncbi:MAG: HD domain-containing protein [Succinivibrio sp.]|nr:HD domain-containing protein [Succinivibrio sp.]